MATEINYNSNFEDLIEKYPDLWENRICKKGEVLIEKGKIDKTIIHIESGILRGFVYGKKGNKEVASYIGVSRKTISRAKTARIKKRINNDSQAPILYCQGNSFYRATFSSQLPQNCNIFLKNIQKSVK